MMEAVRTSETSVNNHSTWQYNPEDSSEQNTQFVLANFLLVYSHQLASLFIPLMLIIQTNLPLD
jgi:hypothetical protein